MKALVYICVGVIGLIAVAFIVICLWAWKVQHDVRVHKEDNK